MSLTDNRGIPPGNAAIIAAVIAATALILGAIIGVVFGAKSQPIQVFLGVDTPILGVQSSILGLPLPQPTYTLLPIYTPFPTLKPNVAVVTPKSPIVTATPSADQQNPPPGSTILAGQGYARSNVIVTLLDSISPFGDKFSATLIINNQSSRELPISWSDSLIHVKDDRGKTYNHYTKDTNYGFAVPSGDSRQLGGPTCNTAGPGCIFLVGGIDPAVKYLVFTLDSLAGMTNMNWRYDLQ